MFRSIEVVEDTPFRTTEQGRIDGLLVQLITAKHSGDLLGAHFHKGQEERYVVLRGSVLLHTFEVDGEGHPKSVLQSKRLLPGVSVVVPPKVAHMFEADAGSVLVLVNPASKEDFHRAPTLRAEVKALAAQAD